MPARKNNPHKFGVKNTSVRLKDFEISKEEHILAQKLIEWEKKGPFTDHYVGWPDMDVAEKMEKKGFLKRSERATGCFFLTDLFKRQFQMVQNDR